MSCELQNLDPSGEGHALAIAGELCVFHTAELKSRLMQACEADSELEIDLSGVVEVDTAGIQLLLFAKREAVERGCCLTFVNHSEPVVDLIELFGLSCDLDDAPASPQGTGESK